MSVQVGMLMCLLAKWCPLSLTVGFLVAELVSTVVAFHCSSSGFVCLGKEAKTVCAALPWWFVVRGVLPSLLAGLFVGFLMELVLTVCALALCRAERLWQLGLVGVDIGWLLLEDKVFLFPTVLPVSLI